MRRAISLLILGVVAAVAPAGIATASPLASTAGYLPAPTPPVPTPSMPFRTINLAGGRSYVLHPPTLSTQARPLVLLLPGLYNTWLTFENQGNWQRYADTHGFVAAYGTGISRSWNAGSCCGAARQQGVDDVSYLVAVVADVSRRIHIDPTRVYVVGFSNGEMMAIRAQCDRPDVFAASGGAGGQLVTPCHSPDRQIRERHLHGTADTIVPYNGGYSAYTGSTFPSVAALPGLIAADSPDPAVSITSLPCAHTWPRLDNTCRVDATDIVWRWISRYSRTSLTPAALRAAVARLTGTRARPV
jgi:poly(3-hydroxybutyrate) depolymerase